MAPRAHDELCRALDWYARHSSGAVSKFAMAVDNALDAFESDPGRFPALNEQYRYARIFGFPYYIAFQIKDDRLNIAAFRHASRTNPEFEA